MALFMEAHYCRSCDTVEASCPCCGGRMREAFREADNCGTGAGGFQAGNTCAGSEGGAAPALDDRDVQALRGYTGAGSAAVNGFLRGDNPNPLGGEVLMKKQIAAIDRVISKSVIAAPQTVFRGIRDAGLYKNAEKLVGRTIDSDVFLSTSPDRERAERFAQGQHPVMISIALPKGATGLALHELPQAGKLWSDEPEVLLPRGQAFRVLSVDRKGSVPHIHLEPVAPSVERKAA